MGRAHQNEERGRPPGCPFPTHQGSFFFFLGSLPPQTAVAPCWRAVAPPAVPRITLLLLRASLNSNAAPTQIGRHGYSLSGYLWLYRASLGTFSEYFTEQVNSPEMQLANTVAHAKYRFSFWNPVTFFFSPTVAIFFVFCFAFVFSRRSQKLYVFSGRFFSWKAPD